MANTPSFRLYPPSAAPLTPSGAVPELRLIERKVQHSPSILTESARVAFLDLIRLALDDWARRRERRLEMARPTGRNRQVVRQWEVLNALEAGPRTIEELARMVGDGGVTPRTIRRDFQALKAARFPIYSDRDDDGQVRWGC